MFKFNTLLIAHKDASNTPASTARQEPALFGTQYWALLQTHKNHYPSHAKVAGTVQLKQQI
ncbi:MAG: hypothetical protein B7Y56_08935 [Gallionellales bacterium 35-53-114]|jgi:hypothetical protein|nr:MAG: hypothetical protein B7Y56_08935 [Gallionellales bacterium 35-53-114]OYZ62747.1 MAG: hypothetical protein B7Y04_12790 [Gallionellales bacterium 24-53-125]OZB09823.1 MAG: hypothetical protein B7X61_04690 [Gallionellales bacterium 39-52-133]HQS57612.1 hypothetical protein [Gallionellaceae bacterium]HQS74066.1 hypothetical protein [Gallionellaceae bacterium]